MFSKFGDSFLLEQFREFHGSMARAAAQAKSLVPEVSGDSDTGGEELYEKLLSILERQSLEARHQGGDYGARYYEEAQYVMAALADDVFLAMDWSGAEEWKISPLEHRLFGTKLAGVEFYRRLDRLLEKRDSARTELAAVFLLGIALGFRGKYRGRDDGGALQRYRERLYNFIYNRAPRTGESGPLFPEAYAVTVAEGSERPHPSIRLWARTLIVVVVVMLGLSYVLWRNATQGLPDLLNKILTAAM